MNELPVIGSLCLRKDFWDRYGANITTVRGPKKPLWREIMAFRRCFIRIGLGNVDTREA